MCSKEAKNFWTFLRPDFFNVVQKALYIFIIYNKIIVIPIECNAYVLYESSVTGFQVITKKGLKVVYYQ